VSHYSDALGRDTLVVTPIDSADHAKGGAADSTTRLRQRVVYSVMDRDSISESIAPNRVQTLQVVKGFDPEGNDTSLSRTPLGASAHIGTVTTKWRYDRANRRLVEIAPDGFEDSTVYDPAGNTIAAITRDAHTIAMTYDPLNRLARRSLPAYSYPTRPSGFNTWPTQDPTYPAYPILAETDTFTYDAMGRLRSADNQDAKVFRTYYRGGVLEWDSLRIQTLNRDNWEKHKYGIRHVYDLDGREASLLIPSQIPGAQLSGDIGFGYDQQTGALNSVSDLHHDPYTFNYNPRGDIVGLNFPGALAEHLTFDQDGRLTIDTILNSGGTTFPRYDGQILRADQFRYDAQGRLVWHGDALSYKDTTWVTYSGLGHIAT